MVRSLDLPLRNLFFASTQPDAPLLIVMHGLGDRMESFRDFPDLLFGDRIHTLLLNAPDPYVVGFSWYELDGRQGPGLRRSRQLLEEIADRLGSTEPGMPGVPKERIVLSGFSQGAVVSLYTALRAAKAFAGVGALSGYFYGSADEISDAGRKTPVFMAHGLFDPVLPCETSRGHATMLEEAGIPLTWREYSIDHSLCTEEMQDFRSFLATVFAL